MSYFPLKRASSPEQYMLGRTFLQETYISVDYDRWVFNISQAYSRGNPRVFAITSPSNATSDVAPHHFRISSGVYAGIGVGAGLTIIALALAVLLWHNKGEKRSRLANKRSLIRQRCMDKTYLGLKQWQKIEVSLTLLNIVRKSLVLSFSPGN
jgi:hypothetical protein